MAAVKKENNDEMVSIRLFKDNSRYKGRSVRQRQRGEL